MAPPEVTPGTTPPVITPEARRKSRRTLLLIALVAVAPVIASYAAYYLFPRDKQVNYGELLPTRPPPGGDALAEFKGRWILVFAAPAACDAPCGASLYATRQARTIQNREMERVARVWLVTDEASPDPARLAEHPDLAVRRGSLASWPAGPDRIYLVDPLGNLVLAWPRDPDIRKMAADVGRLLKASRIG
ncbi:MAG: cytochrome c oxidase subunit I [Burkholderiales bacterium]